MKTPHCTFVSNRGATLVEVLIAGLILTVLALGSAGYVYYSRLTIGVQRDKRAAIEMAHTRLEALRAAPAAGIASSANGDYTLYYVADTGGSWGRYASDPGETWNCNGMNRSIVTSVRKIDLDGATSKAEAIRMTVAVWYRPDESVTLQTIRMLLD